MVIHRLKILHEYFEAQKNRVKTFEIRKNDRNFKVGDSLMLYEIDPKTKQKNYCKNTHYVRTARRAALYASKNENIFSDDIRYIMDTDSVAVRKI